MLGFGSRKARKEARTLMQALEEAQSQAPAADVLVDFTMLVDGEAAAVSISVDWDEDLEPDHRPAIATFAYLGYVTKQAWNFAPDGASFISRLASGAAASNLETVAEVEWPSSTFAAQAHLNLNSGHLFAQTPSDGYDEQAADFAADLAVNLRDYILTTGLCQQTAVDLGLTTLTQLIQDGSYDPDDMESAFAATLIALQAVQDAELIPTVLE